jgi:hypothetical protein
MPHEYDDPVTVEIIEASVQLTVRLRAERRSVSLHELATEAVDTVFCSCVASAADASVPGVSPVRAGLAEEVVRQVRLRSAASAGTPAAPDPA